MREAASAPWRRLVRATRRSCRGSSSRVIAEARAARFAVGAQPHLCPGGRMYPASSPRNIDVCERGTRTVVALRRPRRHALEARSCQWQRRRPPAIRLAPTVPALAARRAASRHARVGHLAHDSAHELGSEQPPPYHPCGVPCCSITPLLRTGCGRTSPSPRSGHRHDQRRTQDQLAQPRARLLAQLRVEVQQLALVHEGSPAGCRPMHARSPRAAAGELVRQALGEHARLIGGAEVTRSFSFPPQVRRAASIHARRCRRRCGAATARTTEHEGPGCASPRAPQCAA